MPKQVAKLVKPRNIWLRDLVEIDPEFSAAFNYDPNYLKLQAPRGGLCAICKGSKTLCGKTTCPLIAQLTSHLRIWRSIKGLSIDGASPPSVFVGRFGYPYVYIGPMTPPFHGDTSILDQPEAWLEKPIEEIIEFRSQLIRGMYRVHVKEHDSVKILDQTRELSLSEHYVDTELTLKKPPTKRLYMDDDIQPIGPTAPLERINLSYIRWQPEMEKAYYDTDLRAAEAAKILYKKGVAVTTIQRAFSLGNFGLEKNRRLVPTRWSITAVDDILSKDLSEKVKEYPQVNQFEVYESNRLGNRFIVVLVPDAWSYEAYEAWYPKTLWNPSTRDTVIITDWEGFNGRTTYASMGGCYYSGRLAVLEHLYKAKRQARVFIFRESYPNYIAPLGVWQVRENVRNAMRQTPFKFNSLEAALRFVESRLSIGLEHWLSSGYLLKQTVTQRKITEFI